MTEQSAEKARLDWFTRTDDDFPFYNGEPVAISAGQWIWILAAIALGFACLTAPVQILVSTPGQFVRALLFSAIPLTALRVFAGPYWTRLFRRIRSTDVLWMIGFAVLNLIVSSLMGILVIQLYGADPNPVIGSLANQSVTERELFFLRSILQLFGEEVLTILPFLAVMYFGYTKLGLSRNKSILLAWVASSVIFGLMHLSSYNWNLIQCLVVIGSARLILTLAYLKTCNIWVSTGTHIINDWLIFGIILLGTAVPQGA